ncbi:YbbR-like domain-containing protein [Leyella stercorea]|uniref:YbbR-like domain-containing protein n=1 Tax=Leyella stercorea TaxID=363265 RepID=UPI002431332B|nr:YbbR-like domain-containing protein [Leyella stercorea]
MEKRLTQIINMVRNFLFSSANREFLTFFFFLVLSSIFWLMTALNETYEREIGVPAYLVNIPKNVVVTSDMEDTVRVTVRDKGFALLAYTYGEGIRPINVNFQSAITRQSGYGVVSSQELMKMINQRFSGSSKIVQVKPDRLDFHYNYGLSRQVSVKMSGHVVPGKSFYLARTRFWPEKVTVYGSKQALDSLRFVKTVPINITNFNDTVLRTVALETIKGVKIVPNTVRIGLYPDILTEENIEVPITAINMPEGKVLRTFPQRVTVNFIVGASMFRSISPEQFAVVVDYNEIIDHPSDKCSIHLRETPQGVRNARLKMTQVDYLIEEQ